MTRIGICGIAGRMGRLLAEEALAGGAAVSGGIDRPGANTEGLPGGISSGAATACDGDGGCCRIYGSAACDGEACCAES